MLAAVKSFINRVLPKNTFARGVSVLVGGTAGAQLLSVLAAPVLTRLYSPEDFGLLAIYASLLALVGVASSLRYELAIPLPESDEEGAGLVLLSLMTLLFFTFLSSLVLVLFGSILVNQLGVPELKKYLWLLPVGVFLGGLYNVFTYWALRNKRFGDIARTRIRQTLLSLTIQVSLFKLGGFALLVGQVVGKSAGSLDLGRPALRLLKFRGVNFQLTKSLLFRYKKFPTLDMPSAGINAIAYESPFIILSYFFNPTITGLYMLANRILLVPKFLITSAVGEVFYSHASDHYRNNTLKDLTANLYRRLVEFTIPPMIMVTVISPDAFELIFGQEWRRAGLYAQIMAIPLGFKFILMPFTRLFTVLEMQGHGVIFHATLCVGTLLALLLGGYAGDDLIALIAISIVTAVAWLGFLIWVCFTLRLSVLRLLGMLVSPTIIGFISVLPTIAALYLDFSLLQKLFALVISLGFLAFYFYKKNLLRVS